jgi:hypothetical protein
MGTIAVTHHHIIGLLAMLAEASQLLKVKAPWVEEDTLTIRRRYLIGVSPYIAAFHMGDPGAHGAYQGYIAQRNTIGAIYSCIGCIEEMVAASSAPSATGLPPIIARKDEFQLPLTVRRNTPGECTCGGRFAAFVDSCERKCGTCGMTATDFGAIFDDVQMYSADGQKPKQGRHYPSQHCKLWITRIQAHAGVEISEAVQARLRACCKRDGINMKKMACEQLRQYFKECGLTKLNNYVPYCRKVLTGIAPPELTCDELDDLYGWFNKIVEVLKSIRNDHNITYYPYIIYKILDHILPFGLRKAQILECIHLQSDKTMREVDEIWMQICSQIPGLKPKATNKHEYELML